MPKRDKFINKNFGPLDLLSEDARKFCATRNDVPEVPEQLFLINLAWHPENARKRSAAEWLGEIYASRPDFTCGFLHAMRCALARKSAGEKWLYTPEALTKQKELDKIIEDNVGLKPRELSTARAKLRTREALQRKRKLL